MKNTFFKYLCVLGLLCCTYCLKAQDHKEIPREVFTITEQAPTFPGGKNALNKYVKKHLRYPTKSMKSATEGKVVLRFIVEPDGKLSNEEVISSMNPECDKAALEVIKEMPRWDPAMQNGVFVAAYYTLPITFAMH